MRSVFFKQLHMAHADIHILFHVCNGRDFGVQKAKNGDRGRIVFIAKSERI